MVGEYGAHLRGPLLRGCTSSASRTPAFGFVQPDFPSLPCPFPMTNALLSRATAISSNSTQTHPQDGPEKMKEDAIKYG